MSTRRTRPAGAARQEKAIPDHAPAKELAEWLRELRRRAGAPSYRDLGRLIHLSHNALSQAVDGRYVRWTRVEQFLLALRAYQPGSVTDDDVFELRRLHRHAREQHHRTRAANRTITGTGRDSTRPPGRPTGSDTRPTDRLDRASRGANRLDRGDRTDPHRPGGTGAFDGARAVVAETDRIIATAAEEARATRAPGQWHTTDCTPRGLYAAATGDQLTDLLHHLVVRKRPDLLDRPPGNRPNTDSAGDDAHGRQLVATVIAGGQPPAPHLLRQLIRLCGGTDGDRLAWTAAWQRVHTHDDTRDGPLSGPQPGQEAAGRRGIAGVADPTGTHPPAGRLRRWLTRLSHWPHAHQIAGPATSPAGRPADPPITGAASESTWARADPAE